MQVQCSRCGKRKSFSYTVMSVAKLIESGWGSYGNVLYCPECSRTWHDRNDKEMANSWNTVRIIDERHMQLSRQKGE